MPAQADRAIVWLSRFECIAHMRYDRLRHRAQLPGPCHQALLTCHSRGLLVLHDLWNNTDQMRRLSISTTQFTTLHQRITVRSPAHLEQLVGGFAVLAHQVVDGSLHAAAHFFADR